MSHNVFSNTSQVSGKAGSNKSIARFPDVCLSPPSPPAGPIPIPYPDTSMSSDLKKGSKTVKLGGKPACLAQQSHYKPSALGNEAATKSFGASVITHVITGKTVFQSWSMDVKFEGKNVCRHIDLTTSNHNCPPPATPPLPTAEGMNLPGAGAGKEEEDDTKCACCGEDAHPWQTDNDGKPFPKISEEEFWKKQIAAKSAGGQRKSNLVLPDMLAAKAASRASDTPCPNVHPADGDGCGTYYDIPPGFKREYQSRSGTTKKKTPAKLAADDFGSRGRALAVVDWNAKHPGDDPLPADTKMNHKTPRMGGGCNSPDNIVPDTALSGDCAEIEAWQSSLERTG